MWSFLLFQVWTASLPGAGGEVKTTPLESGAHYELTIQGKITCTLIGKQFDAKMVGDEGGNFREPHTYLELSPLLGEPTRVDPLSHSYTWEIDGEALQGKSITIRSSIAQGLAQNPIYAGQFSKDKFEQFLVGDFKARLDESAKVVQTSAPPAKGNGLVILISASIFLLSLVGFSLLLRNKKGAKELEALSKKVAQAAEALFVSAKKQPTLSVGNMVRDAKQAAQELARAGEHARDFIARTDLTKITQEEKELAARAAQATDEEAKKTWTEAAQEKAKARAAVEEAQNMLERAKARLLRLSASLESTRLSIEAPSQHQKTDESVLSSLQEELRLASEAAKDAEKLV